ncbi:efflux RND transporter periplasmic adaptor subunit [Granulicella sp. S156]|jgi:RND family efflux transporter MFP subunit|uniref:efflux RND transporter periplasmic adaptor subunit n=1 Tax=Granulicella sp. S156 TaxID=1747224 RepID=UPI00131D63E2|nr:efflux RND transporter periplasmic adaptor subunit [Granulicella sp. S156]
MALRLRMLALAALTTGAAGLTSCHQATPVAAADVPNVPVATAAPATLTNDLVLTAEFVPYQDVDVMAKVAGYVKNIRVDIGDHVRQGDLLATLEVPELQDEMGKAIAGVSAAQANILTAEGAVKRAEAGAAIAHLSYQRILDVSTKNAGLVPRQEVDVAQSHDLEASAQLASAQSELRAAKEGLTEATSERSRTEAMLAYATIRAPFTGVVTKRYANTGSMIQAGTASQTQAMPIVQLAQNDLLRLIFPVPVNDAAQIRDGQQVSVNVVTLGKTFPGTITRYADTLQTSTRTMSTEVDVPNPKGLLIPGMYAEVRLHEASGTNVLSVPLDGVEGLGGNAESAYLVRDGKVVVVPITTGVQTPTRVQILSGVQQGDTVIVGRHTTLSAGEKVNPQPAGYESNGSTNN